MPIQQPAVNIPFEELSGSPTEEFTEEGFQATRTLKCPWDDRFRLAQRLIGGVTSGGVLVRPQAYDRFPMATVSGVQIRPFARSEIAGEEGDEQQATYTEAQLTVRYSTPDARGGPGADEDEQVHETVEISKEFMTLPAQRLYWEGGEAGEQGEAIGEDAAPGILIPMLVWSYTRRQLISLPQAAATLVGHVNSSTLSSTSLGLSFGPETLLYDSIGLVSTRNSAGDRTWDATYKLVARATGWNNFLNPEAGEWQPIFREGTSSPWKPYQPANLAAIM